IARDLQTGALAIDPTAEDIHMFVEAELTSRLGDTGKRLHTARSRNDQVALDIRLYLRDQCQEIHALLLRYLDALTDQAAQHLDTVMPGYTHLQRAQPITFAHHLMAYSQMALRDLQRIEQTQARMNVMPLGSGALAGTTYPIDRQLVKTLLAFDAVSANSLDGVSDRDFCIELAGDIALIMMHLSRLSEEIILWCSWEFKFIELDDAFATGSSIMPQKKNPDVTELIRGKTGRVYGDLNTLLVMMKGIPLAYDKDMQEDKEAIFDAVDTLELCLRTVTPMLATMTPLPANMRRAAAKGFINATDCADYLTKKGMPFRDAYKCTGTMVAACIREGKTLEELTLDEFKQYSDLFEDDVYTAIDLTTCCEGRTSYGGPTKASVMKQVADVKGKLA
uniref:argininosuccinate lyase n=1 Tax=Gemmiger formicilis TaxID=745368 RepID=UPI003FF0858F